MRLYICTQGVREVMARWQGARLGLGLQIVAGKQHQGLAKDKLDHCSMLENFSYVRLIDCFTSFKTLDLNFPERRQVTYAIFGKLGSYHSLFLQGSTDRDRCNCATSGLVARYSSRPHLRLFTWNLQLANLTTTSRTRTTLVVPVARFMTS